MSLVRRLCSRASMESGSRCFMVASTRYDHAGIRSMRSTHSPRTIGHQGLDVQLLQPGERIPPANSIQDLDDLGDRH